MDVVWVICTLIGVLGLIALMLFGSRWLNKHMRYGGEGQAGRTGRVKNLKIIEVLPVAPDKQVMIISAGRDKFILVGVSPGGVNRICALNKDDLFLTDDADDNGGGAFFDNLKKVISDKYGRRDNGPEVKSSDDSEENK